MPSRNRLNHRYTKNRSSAGPEQAPGEGGLSVSELMVDNATENDGRANWLYSCPVMPGMNAAGTNTAISTSEVAMMGPARLLRGPLGVRLAVLELALDVLHHHDRIVDHQTHREHETQQRKQVDGETEPRQHREGRDERDESPRSESG